MQEVKPKEPINIQELSEQALIPQGVEIPKPEVVFGMDGVPVFTKKSISTLIGKAKSGKTTCSAWVVAQAILKEMNILWIDTEQGAYYGSRTQSWVLHIAEIQESPHLKYYDLKIHNPSIRIEIVEFLITTIKPDMVIIDGIRDLVFDINNPDEATIITGNLMRWADTFDCHILSIIHQNKGNEHARGHLGTEMINKSETVIKVSQDDKKLTVCEPEFTRGEPFTIFAFDRDAHGRPFIVNYQPSISGGESNAKKTLPIDIPNSTHYDCLEQAFGIEQLISYGDLIPLISASFEMYGMAMGVVKTKSFMAFYQQQGYIKKAEKKGTKTFYSLTPRNEFKEKDNTPKIQTNFYKPEVNDDEPPF